MERTVSNSVVANLHDIICMRGDTFSLKFRLWQDQAKTVPIDITTNSYLCDVIDTKARKPVLSFSMTDGFSFIAPNILVMSKTDEQMLVQPGNYKYDIQETLSGGEVSTRFKGQFTIQDET